MLEKEQSNPTQRIREDFLKDLSWTLKAGRISVAIVGDESSAEQGKSMSRHTGEKQGTLRKHVVTSLVICVGL